jgi:hypothetical protein
VTTAAATLSPRGGGGGGSVAVPSAEARARKVWSLAAAALSLALAIALAQAGLGVRLDGPGAAWDGPFAVATLARMLDNIAHGIWLPAWSFGGHQGLGSPVLFFYPPGAFWLAAFVGRALGLENPATILDVTVLLLRPAMIATGAAWLRWGRGLSWDAALLGGGLYALMPYLALVNPQLRLAFAETTATALIPLGFLCVDAAGGRPLRLIASLAPVMGALAVTHLPSTVLTGGLLVLQAALSASSIRGAVLRGASAAVGIALGLALAAGTVLPSIVLLPEIAYQWLWSAHHQPEYNFLLDPRHWPGAFALFLDLSLLVPLALALAFGPSMRHGTSAAAARLSLDLRSIAIPALVSVLLMTPLTYPLWLPPTPLRLVQFPSRLLPNLSLLASGLVALGAPYVSRRRRRLLLAAIVASGVAWLGLAVMRSDRGEPNSIRLREALDGPGADSSEHMPAAAAERGWFRLRQTSPTIDLRERARAFVPRCVVGGEQRAVGAAIRFTLRGCGESVVLPQFYFPGWRASSGGTAVAVSADDASGLVRVALPANATELVLERVRRLPVTEAALGVSLAGGLLWVVVLAGVVVGGVRRRRRGPGGCV